MLRIGIDGYNLAMRNGTGVATYGLALAAALKAGGHRVEGVFGLDVGDDPGIREVMFYDLLAREEPKHKTRRQVRRETIRLLKVAARPRLAMRADEVPITPKVEKGAFAARLPAFDRLVSGPRLFEVAHRHFELYGRFVRLRMENPPEIMHWTYPVPIELEGARNVYTLHDLVPLRLPYATLDAKPFYRGVVQGCVDRAAHICTVSEASRADILAEFGMDPARVTNTWQSSPVPPGALSADPAEDAAMIEGVFGLQPQGYFLYFGAIEPKKNVGRLLEAYLSIRTETPLIIVGARAWQSEGELHLLSQGGARSGRVMQLDYLPRGLLMRLVRSARAVVFPSLYEGFGLPVLEAIQLGVPVLTSTASALPEVAGDAALLVDPYDVAAIAAGLQALDTDAALRARLAGAGPAQAGKFSQERYLERLEAMYAGLVRPG